ncbi:hypothetical protein NC652_011422 [Populus alba x Populus x berolinensis]|nr:hypothetical protein NC652_011422 [Populus alba x Populus x berolinensis]
MKMLFSIEERQIYSTKYVASKEICDQSFCVGSSHGYTISINCETELPAKDTFLGRTRDDMDSGGEYIIEFAPEASSTSRFY